MICKTFIGTQSEVRYVIDDQFSNYKIIDCADLEESVIKKMHQPSLFESSQIKCFVNLDKSKVELENLLKISSEVRHKCVWAFTSLKKNTKLFKKLSTISSIEEISDLKKQPDKKQFIKNLLIAKAIPLKFLDKFLIDGSEDRLVLSKDIEKAALIFSKFKDEDLLNKSICKYNGSLDVLEYISNLLDGRYLQAHQYVEKISCEIPALVVGATLLKKIRSLIHLSLDDEVSCNKVWRTQGYFYNIAVKQSMKFTTRGLINLYLYVDASFCNFLDKKDLGLSLCELILFIDRKAYLKSR